MPMRLVQVSAVAASLLLAASPGFAAHPRHATKTSVHAASHRTARGHAHVVAVSAHRTASAHVAGQRSIDPARATEIQGALIKAGYLQGTPSGTWDSETEAAMEKLQSDNGWQTKLVPDARAILKLGLGGGSAPSTNTIGGLEPSTF